MPPAPHSRGLLPVEIPAWNPTSQNYPTLGYDCPGLQRDTALPFTLSRN